MVSEIINPNEEFVVLRADNPKHDPIEIQSIALHRILSSTFVYVVAPDGYIGRTTCYEIGRVIERKIPIYYSHHVHDLPMPIPEEAIVSPDMLITHIKTHKRLPDISFDNFSYNIQKLHSCYPMAADYGDEDNVTDDDE